MGYHHFPYQTTIWVVYHSERHTNQNSILLINYIIVFHKNIPINPHDICFKYIHNTSDFQAYLKIFLYIPWTVHLFHLLFIWGSNNCVSSLPAFDMLRMLTCCTCWNVRCRCSRMFTGGVGGGCNNVPDYTKTVKISYIATGGVAIIGVIWPVAAFFMLYVRSWQFRFQNKNNIITMYRSWDNSTKGQLKLGHRKVSFEMLTYFKKMHVAQA